MSGEIIIEIDEDGNSQVSVRGVAGKSCTDLTKQIEAALGNPTSTTKTRDYSAPEQKANAVKAKG